MSATITFSTFPPNDTTQSTQVVRGTIALTGSYPAGGDTLNLVGSKSRVQSHKGAIQVVFSEQPSATVTPSGYMFYYQPGTTAANGLLRITSASGTEFSAGTYSASLLQANITFAAYFTLGI